MLGSFETKLASMTPRKVLSIAGEIKDRQYDYYTLYEGMNLGFGFDNNLAAAVAVTVLANARRRGMPLHEVVKVAHGPIHAALLQLASDYEAWNVQIDHPLRQEFQQWFQETPESMRARTTQEALRISERPMDRFLVYNGSAVRTSSTDAIFEPALDPSVAIVDAKAIANTIRSHQPGPLFFLL